MVFVLLRMLFPIIKTFALNDRGVPWFDLDDGGHFRFVMYTTLDITFPAIFHVTVVDHGLQPYYQQEV